MVLSFMEDSAAAAAPSHTTRARTPLPRHSALRRGGGATEEGSRALPASASIGGGGGVGRQAGRHGRTHSILRSGDVEELEVYDVRFNQHPLLLRRPAPARVGKHTLLFLSSPSRLLPRPQRACHVRPPTGARPSDGWSILGMCSMDFSSARSVDALYVLDERLLLDMFLDPVSVCLALSVCACMLCLLIVLLLQFQFQRCL